MLNSAFDEWGKSEVDFYPVQLKSEIDQINAIIYEHINSDVYKTGFATNQQAYEEACTNLAKAMDKLESIPGEQRFLPGTASNPAAFRSGVSRAFQL